MVLLQNSSKACLLSGNGVRKGPFSHLPSRRTGSWFPLSPPYWFSKRLWPFANSQKLFFFRGSCCAPFVLLDGHSSSRTKAGESGSPRRKGAGTTKSAHTGIKKPVWAHRCGSVWKLSVAAGGHRYPTVSGYRPAMLPARLVAAALAAPPVLSCHTHRSLSSEKCWDSKNNGCPTEQPPFSPYHTLLFSTRKDGCPLSSYSDFF